MHRPTVADPPPVDRSHPPGVIVAGMGRSGTSLVTQVLGTCGWRLGDNLIEGNRRNPKGFFEDSPLNALHRRMLAAHGLAWNDVDALRRRRGAPLAIPAGEQATAAELMAGYRAGGPWAWKNPKATLFLHAWAELVPEAHVLLCVRHPAGVVASLKRRRDSMMVDHPSALRYVARALSLWRSYNIAAEQFAADHPDRTAIVLVPEDVPALERAAAGAFERDLMNAPARKFVAVATLARPCMQLYERLRARHDPALLDRLLVGPASLAQGAPGAPTLVAERAGDERSPVVS